MQETARLARVSPGPRVGRPGPREGLPGEEGCSAGGWGLWLWPSCGCARSWAQEPDLIGRKAPGGEGTRTLRLRGRQAGCGARREELVHLRQDPPRFAALHPRTTGTQDRPMCGVLSSRKPSSARAESRGGTLPGLGRVAPGRDSDARLLGWFPNVVVSKQAHSFSDTLSITRWSLNSPCMWAGFSEPLVTNRMWQKGRRVTLGLGLKRQCGLLEPKPSCGEAQATGRSLEVLQPTC